MTGWRAERPTIEAKGTTCCYAQSDKQWIADPQGVPWETFFTYGESTVYGEGSLARLKAVNEAACCEPEAIRSGRRNRRPRAPAARASRWRGNGRRADQGHGARPLRRYCIGSRCKLLRAGGFGVLRSAGGPDDKARRMGYSDAELASGPEGANLGLGCGNPQAIAALKPGEVVIDLGSGAGFDCFLAARQVGDSGHVIGVDMTHEMLNKARDNAANIGARNVEFRLGELEHLPVADNAADVILSNCVINLVPDKAQVYREAFRVLKHGGRLAVSDVINIAPLSAELQSDPALLCGCVAGAATADRVEHWLAAAGFTDVRVTPKPESRELIKTWAPGLNLEDHIVSAMVEARKP